MNPGPKTSIDLNQLFTAVGDAILAVDRKGIIVLWNPAAARIFGFQLLPLWTGRAVNFVTSGSGWPFFHSPRGKSGMSHGLNR